MEHKQSEAAITAIDESKGIVEAIWAVMGNLDDVGDIIHPGAFTKTFSERGSQVKLLDNHRTDSVMSVLGKVLELREVGRGELPQTMLAAHPDITGGAWGKFQFLLDTPEGLGAFKRIQQGALSQWSFGYDAVDKDYSNKDGKTARNLRGIRLFEVSPVLFPANSATTTTSAKSQPSEGKPYRAIREGGRWNVYKLDADDNPTGESLGDHDSEDEANRQVAALYASEDDKGAKPEGKAGRVLNSRIAKQIQMAMENLHEVLKAAGLVMEDEAEEAEEMPYDEMMTSGPQKSAEPPTSNEAGPDADDSTRLLKLIEIEIEEMEAK